MPVGPLARVFQTELRSFTNLLQKPLRPVSAAVQKISSRSEAVQYLSTATLSSSSTSQTGLSKKSSLLNDTTRSFRHSAHGSALPPPQDSDLHGAQGSTFSEQAFRAACEQPQVKTSSDLKPLEKSYVFALNDQLPSPEELKNFIKQKGYTCLNMRNVWLPKLTNAHMQALSECTGLTSLSLPRDCPTQHEITPENLIHLLSKLTNLTELDVSKISAVNDDVLNAMIGLKLTRLNLSDCTKITNQGLKPLFSQLDKLEWLGMNGILGKHRHITRVTDDCKQFLPEKTKISILIPHDEK